MAREKEQDGHEDLKSFEAALAALTLSSDRLHRERLMFLAGQALAEARREGAGDQAQPTPGDPDGVPAGPLPCAGQVGSGTQTYRWGWPAAFAAMATIAASLLVAFVVRPPRVVERVVERIVEVPASSPDAALAHEDRNHRDLATDGRLSPWPRRLVEQPSGWTAFLWALFEQNPSASFSAAEGAGYRRLRNLDFVQGLDAWSTPAAASGAASGVCAPSRPSSQRELLEELIETRGARRPEHPGVSPESTSHRGAKS